MHRTFPRVMAHQVKEPARFRRFYGDLTCGIVLIVIPLTLVLLTPGIARLLLASVAAVGAVMCVLSVPLLLVAAGCCFRSERKHRPCARLQQLAGPRGQELVTKTRDNHRPGSPGGD